MNEKDRVAFVGWQPISTAPEETLIIVHGRGYVALGKKYGKRVFEEVESGEWLDGGWLADVTHWMPLPEPPEEDA